jgi:hypothetical protein
VALKTQTDSPKLLDVGPYAPRLRKGAEFWKTYVEEADKWDKELSEGWNKLSCYSSHFVQADNTSAVSTRVKDCFAACYLSIQEVEMLSKMEPAQYQSVVLYARALGFWFSQMRKEEGFDQVRTAVEPLRSLY